MKYCFGVISKNQVDMICDYSSWYNKEVIFIPSRRQVEYNGGYVNNWTTKEFSEYVKSKIPIVGGNIKIQRDHGGPGQGLYDDDGYESLKNDCQYFDLIHIDPWKKYPELKEGIQWTIDMINFCYKENPKVEYEIGTEEGIRPYSPEELEEIIKALKMNLSENIFEKIKYCVVQCGNSLVDCKNNNLYDQEKLSKMVKVVKKYGITTKEHNGDYMDIEYVNKKEQLGLEYINIAPEFGFIESTVVLDHIKNNEEHYLKVYDLCIESGKWKKWVSEDFDVVNEKDKIILITCHYIYSNDTFLNIIHTYDNINEKIKRQIFNKLLYWDGYYTERKKCCICGSSLLKPLLNEDTETPITLSLFDKKHVCPQVPYNILACSNCGSTQIKYLANISLLYQHNHADTHGSVKSEKHNGFKKFILENKENKSFCEVGAATGELGHQIVQEKDVTYTIVEADYKGKTHDKLKIVNSFFEDCAVEDIKADCLIMSDLFEHFYEPLNCLDTIKKCGYEYIVLNHPDFDHALKNNNFILLNIEHTFLLEHQLLFKLFNNYGYKLNRKVNFKTSSLYLEFKRTPNLVPATIKNNSTSEDTKIFINYVNKKCQNINSYINKNNNRKYYAWPCSVHTFTLFLLGMDYKKLNGILDNSPNKLGKYIDGYDLLCTSFTDLIKSNDKSVTIFISGANDYIKELNLDTKCEIKFLEDF